MSQLQGAQLQGGQLQGGQLRGAQLQGRRRPHDLRCGRPGGDGGYVTAEAAMVLPVLLIVLAMAVWVLAAVGAQLRCTDAAGVAARAAARGDTAAAVREAGERVAPSAARVDVAVGPDTVQVTVSGHVRPLGGVLSRLPALAVSGRAVAAREDRASAP